MDYGDDKASLKLDLACWPCEYPALPYLHPVHTPPWCTSAGFDQPPHPASFHPRSGNQSESQALPQTARTAVPTKRRGCSDNGSRSRQPTAQPAGAMLSWGSIRISINPLSIKIAMSTQKNIFIPANALLSYRPIPPILRRDTVWHISTPSTAAAGKAYPTPTTQLAPCTCL